MRFVQNEREKSNYCQGGLDTQPSRAEGWEMVHNGDRQVAAGRKKAKTVGIRNCSLGGVSFNIIEEMDRVM